MKVFGKIIGASAAALCLWGLPAAAQELKLGYVNSERVLRDSAPAKAAPPPPEGCPSVAL